MKIYTKDELGSMLRVEGNHFEAVLDLMPPRIGMPHLYKLKQPTDIGESKKARYVALFDGLGYAFFPSLASAKLWFQEQQWWVAA